MTLSFFNKNLSSINLGSNKSMNTRGQGITVDRNGQNNNKSSSSISNLTWTHSSSNLYDIASSLLVLIIFRYP